jgi:carbon monoxide dehydrogenase subunit G
MSEIVVSKIIEAPPERVWEVLTDLDNASENLTGVVSVQRMTDGPYAVGTRWRETRKMFGREVTEEMWVADNDPWRGSVVRAESGGADYVTTFLLTPLDNAARTELTVRFDAQLTSASTLQKFGMKVFGGLAEKATRKALEQDLTDIAAAAED